MKESICTYDSELTNELNISTFVRIVNTILFYDAIDHDKVAVSYFTLNSGHVGLADNLSSELINILQTQ